MIKVFAGPMFGGKSKALFENLTRGCIQKRPVFIFVPVIDTRKERNVLEMVKKELGDETKLRTKPTICAIQHLKEILDKWDEIKASSTNKKLPPLIGIDEAQFFPDKDSGDCYELWERAHKDRVEIIVAGLDTDFLHKPFAVMAELMALADDGVKKFKAVCDKCQDNNARYTQRLIMPEGTPAPRKSDRIVPGDEGKNHKYEARCADCYEIPDK